MPIQLPGDTLLIHAARHGRVADVVALLADGADVNGTTTDGSGLSALYVASLEGHTEIVTTLIAANADVSQGAQAPSTSRIWSRASAPLSAAWRST